jgi:hypothetical protein
MQIRARGNAFATGIGNWLVHLSFLQDIRFSHEDAYT